MDQKKRVNLELVARITDDEGRVIMEKEVRKDEAITAPGTFDLSTREGLLADFDTLECALIEAGTEMQETVAEGYLEEVKKKTNSEGKAIRKSRIEGEIGRIPCVFCGELASNTGPKEALRSFQMDDLVLRLTPDLSFRKAADLINRVLHRSSTTEVKTSTLCEYIEAQGKEIDEAFEKYAKDTFLAVYPEGRGEVPPPEILAELFKCDCVPEDALTAWNVFSDKIRTFNEDLPLRSRILVRAVVDRIEIDPNFAVYISVDDVGVKHQKEKRGPDEEKNGKWVENTVIHVETSTGTYRITAVGMDKCFERLLAFLIGNDLMNRRFIFFTDGARNIKAAVERWFSFREFSIFLDWYHLEKRVYELLTMAVKGTKEFKRALRSEIDAILWAGNTELAIEHLQNLDSSRIKNQSKMQEAIDYLARKELYTCCYALRSELGYRNSSNPAEKANHVLVASRQKHNGMSWSRNGSGALAAVTALHRNGELEGWIRERKIRATCTPKRASCA